MLKEPQRKLTTVLVADVHGYTRLMEVDEEATRMSLTRHRMNFSEMATRFDGRVLDTSGDSIFAEFASAQLAVNCSVEFQLSAYRENLSLPPDRKMEFRVGLNAGDVLDDGVSIYGDAVNTAARLQELSSPGGICVSGVIHELVDGRVDYSFQFLREQKVKNRRRSVKAFRLKMEALLSASLANLDSAAGTGSTPGIAVLPFKNLGGDESRQYLGDGLAEDITTELSRFRTINVLARTTAFSYRDEPQCFKKLYHELGVNFALEGSIRSVDDRIRIAAQLVECRTGKQIWGDRYTREASAIFEVQDEVAGLIVGMLESRLNQERIKTSGGLYPERHKAYDFWLRGNQVLEADPPDRGRAIELFRKASSLDPDFARAHTSMAILYLANLEREPGLEHFAATRAKAAEHCRSAVRLDPTDARAQFQLGWLQLLRHQFKDAEHQFEVASDLMPNDAGILINTARGFAYLGDLERARSACNRSMMFNPMHPDFYREFDAIIEVLEGGFERATAVFAQCESLSFTGQVFHAATLAHLGNKSGASGKMSSLMQAIHKAWCDTDVPTLTTAVGWLRTVIPLASEGPPGFNDIGMVDSLESPSNPLV